MAITDLEQEKIARADKYVQRKANTLGADSEYYEEPFGNSEIVLRQDIWSETPTASTSFAAPDYGDGYVDRNGVVWGAGGAVATRHVRVQLYAVPNSDTTGNGHHQTFLTVRSTPESDDPRDVEAVRIKHLVPPDLSPGRSHADEVDPNVRGFELALFPAWDNPDNPDEFLDAYDGYGPIPVTADPSAAYGIGSSGRWTVDYANGVVRLSVPPLNDTTGVFNPNVVYATRNGHGTTSTLGRLTLFATFYEYTGPSLTDADDTNFVIVGDGTDSYGNFYGPTSVVMQKAIDSLDGYGGTVFVKEGRYEYYSTVTVPNNVRIKGLSHRAHIIKPEKSAAFRIFGSNSSIEGLTIRSRGTGAATNASIELTDTGETGVTPGVENAVIIENVTIRDNYLYATNYDTGTGAGEPAIGFAPNTSGNSKIFRHINIEDNTFRPWSSINPTFITEVNGSGHVVIQHLRVRGNDFGKEEASAIKFDATVVEQLDDIEISDSYATAEVNIDLDNGAPINRLTMFDNIAMNMVDAYGLFDSMISDNIVGNIRISNGGFGGTKWNNNLIKDFSVDGYVADSVLDGNTIDKFVLSHSASNLRMMHNTYKDDVVLKANGDGSNPSLHNILLEGNHLYQSLQISNSIVENNQDIQWLKISNNTINKGVAFAQDTDGLNLFYRGIDITDNIIGKGLNNYAIVFGEGGTSGTAHLISSRIARNTFLGNVLFKPSVRVMPGYDLAIFDNRFDELNTGLMLDTMWLNSVDIHNNRAYFVRFFNFVPAAAPATDITVKDVSIENNVLYKDISFLSNVDASSNFLELSNINIISNIFEGDGSIDILTADGASADDYRLTDIVIDENKLPSHGSYINVFGNRLLNNDSFISRLSIRGNDVDGTVSVGGAPVTDLNISSNKIYQALHLKQNIDNFVLNNNMAPYILLDTLAPSGGKLANGTINDNSVYSYGMDIYPELFRVSMSNNTIDGYLTFRANSSGINLNESNIVGNTVSGSFYCEESIDSSTLSGNKFGGNFSVADVTDSIVTDNVYDGSFSAASLTSVVISSSRFLSTLTVTGSTLQSVISNSVMEDDINLEVLTDSKLISNTVDGADINVNNTTTWGNIESNVADNITLSAVEISIVNNNIIDTTLTFSGTTSSSVVSGNSCDQLVMSSIINSTVTYNNAVTTANLASSMGSITDSVISNNLFESQSATSNTSFGALSNANFNNNIVRLGNTGGLSMNTVTDSSIDACMFQLASGGSGNITFSTIIRSVISDTTLGVSGSGTISFGSMTESNMEGCNIDATSISISSASNALLRSNISGTRFDDVVTISTTSTSAAAVEESNIVNNNFKSTFTIQSSGSSGVAVSKSTIVGNSIFGSCTLHLTNATGAYAMEYSTFADNRIGGSVTIDHDAAASNTNTVRSSSISGNQIGTILNIASNASTGGGTILTDVVISSNQIGTDTTIGPSGISVTEVSYFKTSVGNNVFTRDLTIRGALSGCVVESNTVGGDTVLDQLYGTVLSSNVFGDGTDTPDNLTLNGGSTSNSVVDGNIVVDGTTILSGTVEDTVFTSNTYNGTFQVDSTLSGCSFTANKYSALDVNSTVGTTSFSDNIISGVVDFAGTFTTSSFSNNTLSSTLTFNDTLSVAVISDNASTSTLTLDVDLQDLVLVGNRFGSVSIDADVPRDDITISGNEFSTLTIDGTGAISNLQLVGNKINGSLAIGNTHATALQRGTIGDNTIEGATDFGVILDVAIVGGAYLGDVRFNENVTNSSVIGIVVNGQVSTGTSKAWSGSTFVGNSLDDADFNATFTTCTINDNTFLQAVTFDANIANSTVSGNTFSGSPTSADFAQDLDEVIIQGNFFRLDTVFDGPVTNCTINSNVMESTLAFGNTIDETTFSNNVVAGSFTASTSTIEHLNMHSNQFNSTITFSGPLSFSAIIGNTITGAASFSTSTGGFGYTIGETTIDSNVFQSTLTISYSGSSGGNFDAALRESTLSNNRIGTDLLIESTSGSSELASFYSSITGNTCGGATSTGSLVAGDIRFRSTDSGQSTIKETIIDGNRCTDMVFTHTATDSTVDNSVISDNVLTGAFTCEAVDDSVISGNKIASTMTLKAITNSLIDGNRVQGATSTEPWTNIHLTGNRFLGTLTVLGSGAVLDSVVSNNIFSSFSSSRWEDSTFSGNLFNSTFLSDRWIDVSCVNNRFASTFTVDNDTSSRTLERCTFQGNVCESTVHFRKDVEGFTNDFLHVAITGNVFESTISIGTSGLSNEISRLIFNNNSGDGALTIYTGAVSEMDSSMIIGNSMSGALTISVDGGGTYPSPPTLGTSHPMIALNWFTSYVGIAFTDARALGWGDNTTAVSGSIVGTNLISSAS